MIDSGNRLYRCRVKVLYKFFGTELGVVFDEKFVQDVSIGLGWDHNLTNMNSESVDTGVMSFTGSMNTCSVTITDPFFTGITWPSLMDVAGAAIGSKSYQSKGILKPKCKPGQDPEEGEGCWDYELIDTANWIPTSNGNQQLSSMASTYKQPAMIMISLWYEAYNGYTFGTDFLYRVSGSSATHGSDFPSVTISGQGNFGITFQDRLVNVSIDNELEVEKALAELAARNQFNMEFCVADYDDPQKLERKVIKSNLTIKQLLDDIVKNKLKGNYASFPTKDMYNTLHVCTRADAWNGCSVFYLNRPLYEQFKISAVVDSTMVGRNIEYGESVEGDSRADGGSGYLPSLLDKDSAWEVIRPKDKKYLDISTMSYDGKELKVGFKNAESAKPINGSWGGFKEKRDKYFTTYNDKLLILEGTDKVLQKKEYNKVNPGWIGEFAGGKASVLLPGRVTELNEIAEGGGHSVAVKTDYLVYLRGMTSKKVSKLPLYADLRLFKADSDVKIGYKVPLGGIVGQSLPEKQQNLAYYISLQNTKVFLDPNLALQVAFPASHDPGTPNDPISSAGVVPTEPNTGGGDDSTTQDTTPVAEGARPMLKFIWPTTGKFTSGHGMRRSPTSGKMAMHRGVDIAAPIGTPIVAAAAGKVVQIHNQCATTGSGGCGAQGLGGYGNSITIDHGNGYRTFYAHLQKDSVKVSMYQVVAQGQPIAGMGSSGNSTGPHLHYELTFSNTNVNPALVVPGGQITAGSDASHRQPSDGVTVNVNADGVTLSPGGQSNANSGQTAPGGGTGFSIETEFKGVPRSLRILPKFTILSLVGDYQQWLSDGMSEGTDPGVWVPDYFRNWLIRSVQFNWTQGDLRVKINASSVFGISNDSIVPRWESYAADLVEQGKYSGYVDYIRAYGDLCWNDGGQPSCHTRCAVTEDFMRANMSNGSEGVLSSANVSELSGCQLEPGKLNLSAEERNLLRDIAAAEALGEGKVGMALVVRAILNRKILIENKAENYGTGGKSDLRSIIFARNGGEFQPAGSGAGGNKIGRGLYNNKYQEIDEAIALAFDYDALKRAGATDYILASPNFRAVNAFPATEWIDSGQNFLRHKFGRDKVTNGSFPIPKLLSTFAARYGKCTKTGPTAGTTGITGCVKPPAGGWKYASTKANMHNWKDRTQRNDKTKKIALAAGHRNTAREGAAGEINYTPQVTQAIASVLQAAGYQVAYLSPSQSDQMSLRQVAQWLKQKNNEGYYATEIHLDIYGKGLGKSGVIPAKNGISIYDQNLAREFGAFDYNWRPGDVGLPQKHDVSILEVASMDVVAMDKNGTLKPAAELNAVSQEIAKRFVSALSC